MTKTCMILIVALSLGLSAAACTRESGQTQLGFTGLRGLPELAVDSSGTTYALDAENKRVLSLAEDASASTVLPFDADIDMSRRLVVDDQGSVYVTDGITVYKLTRGAPRAEAINFGTTDDGEPVFIADFVVDSHGTIFAVTDNIVAPGLPPNRVLELSVGAVSPKVLPFADIGRPDRVGVDGDGSVFVEDIANNRIVTLSKGFDRDVVLPIAAPVSGMVVDTSGSVYTWDRPNNRVMKLPKRPPFRLSFRSGA
jgi:sugar lactone lactonase YvrE